jgi:hypothetical protein
MQLVDAWTLIKDDTGKPVKTSNSIDNKSMKNNSIIEKYHSFLNVTIFSIFCFSYFYTKIFM